MSYPDPDSWRRGVRQALHEPQLCLGTMFFGTTVPEDRSRDVLDRFVDRGGRILDTANCYSWWVDGGTGVESELLLGRWFASGAPRDDLVLATKVGAQQVGDRAEGLDAAVIREGIERSLERLQTGTVDLWYAHLDDPHTPQDETGQAFADVVAGGTVGLLGASNLVTERLASAYALAERHGWPAYEAAQYRTTWLPPRPDAGFGRQVMLDDGLRELTARHGTAVFGYSPLLAGAYSRADRPLPAEYRTPGTARRLALLRTTADALGATPNQVVLAYLLRVEHVIPVIGISTVAQLDEAMDALDLTDVAALQALRPDRREVPA